MQSFTERWNPHYSYIWMTQSLQDALISPFTLLINLISYFKALHTFSVFCCPCRNFFVKHVADSNQHSTLWYANCVLFSTKYRFLMIFKSLPSIIIYIYFFKPGRAGRSGTLCGLFCRFAAVWAAVQHQPSVQSLHMYGYVWTHIHTHINICPCWTGPSGLW